MRAPLDDALIVIERYICQGVLVVVLIQADLVAVLVLPVDFPVMLARTVVVENRIVGERCGSGVIWLGLGGGLFLDNM